jgi:Protein of unknown function (DUF2628)
MATYIVMEPALDRRGESALFIRDGFAPLAVILPAPWLLWHRLWFEAALALCASLVLAGGAVWLNSENLAGIGSILIGIYVALEGGALKTAAARRRGYDDAAIIGAGSAAEAEERYYRARPSAQEPPVLAVSAPSAPRQPSIPGAGLFALPGAH